MEAQDLREINQEGSGVDNDLPIENQVDESQQGKGEEGSVEGSLPKGVEERLARQERKHQREMKRMQDTHERQLQELYGNLHKNSISQQNNQFQQQSTNYEAGNGSVEEQVHRAISSALGQREEAERRALEERKKFQLAKDIEGLHKHLDDVSDKYDDFEDVVRGDAPFTEHMLKAALSLPHQGSGSPGEVFYKLGKNRADLDRISQLLPHQQEREIANLSRSLIDMAREEKKHSSQQPLGQIKGSISSQSPIITEKTPVSELRKLIKTWR